MDFNTLVNPKAKTELFKIYINTSDTSTASYELQGRGVASWTVEQNQDIEKQTDVLGYVDMTRGTPQPVQSGVSILVRSGSVFATMLLEAFYTGDYSKLDDLDILQKFEFVDGTTTGTCVAKLQRHCVVGINSFSGEAGGYLGFEIDIHYSNDAVLGTMTKVDADPVVFTPNP